LALDSRLAEGHLARRLARLVARLDLSALRASYAGAGSPPYCPQRLLLVALHEVSCGRQSPADWHRAARQSEPCRWLASGCEPSRGRWYAFRARLGPHLPGLVSQLVRLALAEGLTDACGAALDGSDLAALASRHRLVNASTLASRLSLLDSSIQADARPPAPAEAAQAKPPGWMARTPRGRVRQRRRLRLAEAALTQRRRLNALRRKEDRRPDDKVAISPSDPQAALGLDKLKTFRPLYNAQLCVDLDTPLVLAYEAYAQPTDAGALAPMLKRLRESVGRVVPRLLADSKYAAGADLAAAEREGVEVYAPWQSKGPGGKGRPGKGPLWLPKESFTWRPQTRTYECPQGQPLRRAGTRRRGRGVTDEVYRADAQACASCPRRGECVRGRGARSISRGEYEEEVERLRARMGTEQGKQLYRRRRQTVELGFADLKEHRGLRRVPGHGLGVARASLGLVVLAHDLRVIDSLLARRNAKASAPRFPLPTVP
jgi:transposase